LVIDTHLELAMNALLWNRDLTTEVEDLRAREREEALVGAGCGRRTVTLTELRRGGVGLSIATVLGRTGGTPTPDCRSTRALRSRMGRPSM